MPRVGTSWRFDTAHVDPFAPIALLAFGSARLPGAGIDLGFVGAPTSRAHVAADSGIVTFDAPFGLGTCTAPLPNNVWAVGIELCAQSFACTASSTLHLTASSGVGGRVAS